MDILIGGFFPGQLVVLGGASGTGKSALAQNVALYAARHRNGTAILSFETTERRVKQRLISILTGVPLTLIVQNEWNERHWRPLLDAHRNPLWNRLHVVGSASLKVGEARNEVQRVSTERGLNGLSPLSLIVVDYLQLMAPAPLTEEERRLHLATTLVQLKHMAQDFNVPVLLVAQLDPATRNLSGKPPLVSDLEVSAVVQSYADTVLLLHREEDKSTADVIAVKKSVNRAGKVELDWHAECVRFGSKRRRQATGGSVREDATGGKVA